MVRGLNVAVAVPGLLGIAMLVGCADLQDKMDEITGGSGSVPRNVAFACDDNQQFKAHFSSDREQARVDAGNKTYNLDYSGRDNGMRVYSDNDDKVRLSVGSEQAYLRVPGSSDYKDCERT
jgi:hypothetical protein